MTHKFDLSFLERSEEDAPSSLTLSPEFVASYRDRKVPWGFGTLSYVVYKRTYARIMDSSFAYGEAGKLEEWYQTVARVVNGAQEIGASYTQQEMEELYDLMFHLKGSLGGRMLWQLGTSTVRRFGANSLLNCWWTLIKDIESFCFVFENLMLGGGVGFSVQKEHVHELPKVKSGVAVTHEKSNDADFIVPDSRQGWVELLRKVLTAFFVTGKSFSYSTILIRSAGEKINGFGGTASGPVILIDGMQKICDVLQSREGKKLRSVDALDICNIIGSIVVAGNVRRSAEIAVGDSDDVLFLKAKRWDINQIPNWRSMSNNTIAADDFTYIPDLAWEGYNGNGEPYGFFNLPLAMREGRLGEKLADTCSGVNPCAEITLDDKECCNLSEIFLNNIDSTQQMMRVAYLLYKTQKAICNMRYIHEETEKIVKKNNRIGIGVTGVCQVRDRIADKVIDLDYVYRFLRAVDVKYSKLKGWSKSIRLTTIKPSGTLSMLSGSTPGVHPGFDRYCLKNLRMSSIDPLVQLCKNAGYHFEYQLNIDGTNNHDTVIGSFPFRFADNVTIASQMSAIDQLELVKEMRRLWADNSISVTVYYRKEELSGIKKWLEENYASSLKTVSFLLHQDHNFAQAPLVSLSEEEYRKEVSKVKPIEWSQEEGYTSFGDDLECIGGACPIK